MPVTTKPAIAVPDVTAGADTATLHTTGASISSGAFEHASIMDMFLNADLVVKFVILLLLLSSFWSWAIIFSKWPVFYILSRRMFAFEQIVWSGELLETRYEQLKHTANHPLSKIFVAGMFEWLVLRKRIQFMLNNRGEGKADSQQIKSEVKMEILHAMDNLRSREISGFEKNLGFLATVGSTAPFVGLFGTVWGIMNSFQSIAMTKNTTLAVVAPGIAEALFATAIGLFAAIPAVIFYNKFANTIADFSDRMEGFIDDFMAIISREFDKWSN